MASITDFFNIQTTSETFQNYPDNILNILFILIKNAFLYLKPAVNFLPSTIRGIVASSQTGSQC